MYSARDDPKGPGFPIRKSTDQRVLAPPRGLSQRATSFIASVRQGIHQMPLKTLDPTKSITSREKSPSISQREMARIAEPAPAKRPAPSLNETHQTSIVAPPSVPKNLKQDDSRPGKSAFLLPAQTQPKTQKPKPSRPKGQKPLTTNFRSTLSNNNGSPQALKPKASGFRYSSDERLQGSGIGDQVSEYLLIPVF